MNGDISSLGALGPGGGQISSVVHVSTRADGRWGGGDGGGDARGVGIACASRLACANRLAC